MNRKNFIGTVCGIIVMALGAVSCKEGNVTSKVVAKTYSIVCNIENYVTNIDSTNLVVKAQGLNVPLGVLSDAMTFISNSVNDVKVKEYLTKANSYVQTINVLVNTVRPEDADKFKREVLGYVSDVKDTLEKAADVLGVSLVTRNFNGDIELIKDEASALLNLMRKK